ncbi:MAG: DUF5651 domain-containing protein [Bacillota bacterium]|nr:DUF5651 domain-containing protein [Bacillota bacterium]
MKSYLNREEKDQALTLALFVDYLNDLSNEWAKHNRNKDSVKSLRMAKSFILRATDTLLKGLDQIEIARLMHQAEKMEFLVCYKDEAVRKRNEIFKLESVQAVETDDLWEICETALGVCRSCRKSPEGCRLRELFVGYGVPVFDMSPGDGKCPYCVEEVSA